VKYDADGGLDWGSKNFGVTITSEKAKIITPTKM